MGMEQDKPDSDCLLQEITIKLPDRLYKTSFAISVLTGYEKYEDYVYDLIAGDIKSQLDGASELLRINRKEEIKQKLIWE